MKITMKFVTLNICLCLSFMRTNAYSMNILTDELIGSPPKNTQTQNIIVSSSKRPEPPAKERDSFASTSSGATSGEERDSFTFTATAPRPVYLDTIKKRPLLKKSAPLIAEPEKKAAAKDAHSESQKNTKQTLLEAISSSRGNLKSFLGKPPAAASESLLKPNPYGQGNLKSSSCGRVENDSTAAAYKKHSKDKTSSEKEIIYPEKATPADFTYVGTQRMVINKPKDEKKTS